MTVRLDRWQVVSKGGDSFADICLVDAEFFGPQATNWLINSKSLCCLKLWPFFVVVCSVVSCWFGTTWSFFAFTWGPLQQAKKLPASLVRNQSRLMGATVVIAGGSLS